MNSKKDRPRCGPLYQARPLAHTDSDAIPIRKNRKSNRVLALDKKERHPATQRAQSQSRPPLPRPRAVLSFLFTLPCTEKAAELVRFSGGGEVERRGGDKARPTLDWSRCRVPPRGRGRGCAGWFRQVPGTSASVCLDSNAIHCDVLRPHSPSFRLLQCEDGRGPDHRLTRHPLIADPAARVKQYTIGQVPHLTPLFHLRLQRYLHPPDIGGRRCASTFPCVSMSSSPESTRSLRPRLQLSSDSRAGYGGVKVGGVRHGMQRVKVAMEDHTRRKVT